LNIIVFLVLFVACSHSKDKQKVCDYFIGSLKWFKKVVEKIIRGNANLGLLFNN